MVLLASGAQAPTRFEIYSARVIRTPPTLAEPGQLGNSWRQFDHRRTQQEGMYQAVYARNNSLKILMVKGPSGPGVDGKQILILPAGNYEQTKVARPRNRGTGGKVTVSTTVGRCSPEPSPGDLWFFSSLERTRFNACAAAAPNRSPDTPTQPNWGRNGDMYPYQDTEAG